MAASEVAGTRTGPRQIDLDRCVHCGLCLNACPTYRELGVEMDSPRGRIYQMVNVAEGKAEINPSYIAHIDLCLACRGCETACPSGVQYGKLVEAARADIQARAPRPLGVRLLRRFVFGFLLQSRTALRIAGALLFAYRKLGVQQVMRSSGIMKLFGPLGRAERIAPAAEAPSFFSHYGKTFPAEGEQRYRVALLGGCVANIFFARLNEATVRVLSRNGCEVSIPDSQTCCGALHVHAGAKREARIQARRNIEALAGAGFDAILTNASGCGSALKEYRDLLEDDPAWAERAAKFSKQVRDVNEFLASIELNRNMGPLELTVTYQDSCHLAHGQKIRTQPRNLLRAIPGLAFREMPLADICCGSAGIYNVVQNEMSMQILEKKMWNVNLSNAAVIATANPGCMLQLRAGVELHGRGQRVAHVVELLDEAYAKYRG